MIPRQVKDWLSQALVWHSSEVQNIERAATAKGFGLDPNQYARPFPGSPPNTTVVNLGQPASGSPPAAAAKPAVPSWLKVALLAAVAGAAGFGLSKLPAPAPSPQEFEFKWELGEDGSMKVEPVK